MSVTVPAEQELLSHLSDDDWLNLDLTASMGSLDSFDAKVFDEHHGVSPWLVISTLLKRSSSEGFVLFCI